MLVAGSVLLDHTLNHAEIKYCASIFFLYALQGFASAQATSTPEPLPAVDGLGLDDMTGLTEELHALLDMIEERGKWKEGGGMGGGEMMSERYD